jgi:putative ATP-dependent endonuclease of OLD family
MYGRFSGPQEQRCSVVRKAGRRPADAHPDANLFKESMQVARLTIKNFRNLAAIDVPLAPGAVLVGGNRAGKSNLLFAVRLVLDATLTSRERSLAREDFSEILNTGDDGWDPMREGLSIEISVELTDIEEEPAVLAALGDALIEGNPMRAKVTYRFAPEDDQGEDGDGGDVAPRYRWTIFGGDEDNELRWDVRRFLAHVHLPALRDAESELVAWRRSPLRPLLEAAAEATDPAEISRGCRPPFAKRIARSEHSRK